MVSRDRVAATLVIGRGEHCRSGATSQQETSVSNSTETDATRRVWGPPRSDDRSAGSAGSSAATVGTPPEVGPRATGTASAATGRIDHAGASGGRETRPFGDGPPPPPPARPSDDEGATRPGLPMRSYLAIALTAALGAGAVIVPSQLLADDVRPTVSDSADGEAAARNTTDTTEPEATTAPVEPLPGAASGSQTAAIAERLTPSVLRVNVTTGNGQGSGSAVVFDSAGHIITNNHVIENATSVTVITPDGQELDAEIVGADPSTDIAVLLVDAERQLPVPSFSTEEPAVGELAVAIGSPFGIDSTVTSGIISGLGRQLNAPDTPLFDLIQTDAAINPGNSGGALVDAGGQVIGINTAILSRSGANDGIGFAVPSTTAMGVAEDLIEFGEVRAGFIGIEGQTLTEGIAEDYGVEATSGAIIANVMPDSPADDADLRQGDIIIRVDDEDITSMNDLSSLIRDREPGEDVTLTILRDGEEQQLDLTLGTRPTR